MTDQTDEPQAGVQVGAFNPTTGDWEHVLTEKVSRVRIVNSAGGRIEVSETEDGFKIHTNDGRFWILPLVSNLIELKVTQ